MWLWAVAPLIVVCTALGLSIAVRALAGLQRELVEERRAEATERHRAMRRDLAGMRHEIAALGNERRRDSDAGTPDR